MPLPCIIDTDVALDDWMAILYLLSSPQVDVRAITVVATGEAHAGPGVRTIQGLLALTHTRGVHVAAGRSTPLRGQQAFPRLMRLAMDVRLLLRLPKPLEPASNLDAVALLTQEITTSPQPVTIVALGPLTNLAEALLATPSLADKIARIVIMGGALRVAGNIREVNPRIENCLRRVEYLLRSLRCGRGLSVRRADHPGAARRNQPGAVERCVRPAAGHWACHSGQPVCASSYPADPTAVAWPGVLLVGSAGGGGCGP